MKTKLSNDMKTFLECTDLAAREVGDTGFKNWLIFKLDAEQLEHLERAAAIYTEQSNSHKPVVVRGGAIEAVIIQGDNTITEDKSQTTTLTTPTEPLGNEAVETKPEGGYCECDFVMIMRDQVSQIAYCAKCDKEVNE